MMYCQQQFVTFKIAKSEHDNFDITLLETKIDYCRVAGGVRSSILSRIMFENAAESAGHNLSCPVPTGTHRHINQLHSNQNVPPFPMYFFPTGKGRWLIKNRVHGKVEGEKKAVKLYEWEIIGLAKNADMFPI